VAEIDGWEYQAKPDGGDCRKIVTLDQDGMCWVGIRAYNATTGQWLNGGEPERATVLAWRDLDEPARGRWIHGKLVLGRREFLLSDIAPGLTLAECGCSEGFCVGVTDGTCRYSTSGAK